MKILLTILIILQLIVIWFFFLKGNVKFTFPGNLNNIQTPDSNESPIDESEKSGKKADPFEDTELVPKSTIKIEDLRHALSDVLPDVLPGIVKEQVAEILHEQEVEFDENLANKRITDINKAFEDNRIEGIAEGHIPAPIEDEDDSVPDFNELDRSLRIISDKDATKEQKEHAMQVAVCVQDSNIVVALPEPLHTQLVDMLADFNAQEIEQQDEKSETPDSTHEKPVKHKIISPKKIPDNIEDFNLSEYKPH